MIGASNYLRIVASGLFIPPRCLTQYGRNLKYIELAKSLLIWITVHVGLDSQILLTLTEETLVLLNHLPLDPLQKDGSHIINPNISHGFDF